MPLEIKSDLKVRTRARKDIFLYPQLPLKSTHLSTNEIFEEIARQDAEIREGYEIIPEELYIRYTSEEDIERIKKKSISPFDRSYSYCG